VIPSGPYRWQKVKQGIRDFWEGAELVRGTLTWIRRKAPRFGWFLARVAAAVGLLYIARELEEGELKVDQAGVIAGLFILALIAVSLGPGFGQTLLQRLAKVSVGPVGLELVEEAQKAAASSPSDEGEASASISMQELRLQFERKLSYIANDQLATGDTPRFVTIGSLRHDGFITEAEERTLARVMVLRTVDLETLPADEREAFTEAARKVVLNIRASVLHGHVRKLVKEELVRRKDRPGWKRIEVAGSPRNNLVVQKGEESFYLRPVFTTSSNSRLLAKAHVELLKKRPQKADKRIIVVPRTFNVKDDELEPEPDPETANKTSDAAIVTTDQLIGYLLGEDAPAGGAI